jgi:hypothetical protein
MRRDGFPVYPPPRITGNPERTSPHHEVTSSLPPLTQSSRSVRVADLVSRLPLAAEHGRCERPRRPAPRTRERAPAS